MTALGSFTGLPITLYIHNAEKNQINEIVENNLQNIHEFCNELILGKHPIA